MIRDIALIALALAHGADDDLAPAEVEEMASRLQGWRRDSADPTALAALKDALNTYVQAEGEDRLEAAITRVGQELSADDRGALLADLASVALADGTVVDEERRMLEHLCQRWGVPWPLDPESAEESSNRVSCEDLARLYLHVACDLDGTLAPPEMELTMELLEAHAACSESDLFILLQKVHEERKQPAGREIEAVLGRIKNALDAPRRAGLLAEVRRLAHADGHLHPSEEAFLASLAARWEVTEPVA